MVIHNIYFLILIFFLFPSSIILEMVAEINSEVTMRFRKTRTNDLK